MTKKISKSVALLALVMSMTACHQEQSSQPEKTAVKTQVKAKTSSVSHSGTKTSQSTKASTDSSSTLPIKESTTQTGATSTNQLPAPEGNSSKTEQSLSKINTAAMAQGDFSSVAGTWETTNGDRIVFNASGIESWRFTMMGATPHPQWRYLSHTESEYRGEVGIFSGENTHFSYQFRIVPASVSGSQEDTLYLMLDKEMVYRKVN